MDGGEKEKELSKLKGKEKNKTSTSLSHFGNSSRKSGKFDIQVLCVGGEGGERKESHSGIINFNLESEKNDKFLSQLHNFILRLPWAKPTERWESAEERRNKKGLGTAPSSSGPSNFD